MCCASIIAYRTRFVKIRWPLRDADRREAEAAVMRTSLHRRIVAACRLGTLGSGGALLRAVSQRKNSYQLFLLATTSLRPVGRARGCKPRCRYIEPQENKKRTPPSGGVLFLSYPNNFEPLIPMRNLIFLSHSFLIESDIRTFSAFQDQSSAVLSMCINRLKVTSCGFQFLS